MADCYDPRVMHPEEFVVRQRVDTKRLVMRVQMPRAFGFRMWLTVRLMKLAGIVSPVTLTIGIDAS